MKLILNCELANKYKSPSQKTRVLTEDWVESQGFCPNCGNIILKYPNNRPVSDFYCPKCNEDFELKSKQNKIGLKLVDGAYRTMLEKLTSGSNPNLFLLSYDITTLEVIDFLVIPKHFFIPELIEKRKPLPPTAKRAGWIGCNIVIKNIPKTGKIFFVHNKRVEPKKKVLANWGKTIFLREEKEIIEKGWLLDIMRCIDKIGKTEFTLAEVYFFEEELRKLHPENKHIKAKIRQQLQILRDKGYLEFVSRAKYKLT